MSEPEAKTAEEIRRDFMDTLRALADYWAGKGGSNVPGERTCHERLQGLVHSVLCIFDGVSGGLPAFDIVARPHPDDKAYHIAEGEDWIEDGTVINDTMLHEFLYVAGREDGWGKAAPGDRDAGMSEPGEAPDFDAVPVCDEVSPGGVMVIPPQYVSLRITGLAEGGCRIEAIPPGIRERKSRGSVKIGVRKTRP